MSKKILFIFLFLFCFGWIFAQEVEDDISYSDPKSYVLGGVSITGLEGYDDVTLIAQSGLRTGRVIKVPGSEITRAVRRLYELGIFSNVIVVPQRIVGDTIYLNIELVERHRLSSINYIGLKKSEESKIKEQIGLLPGQQITENIKSVLRMTVERYLKDKGYYSMNVRILQRDDPEVRNHVILDVIVEKNNKIKIKEIVISGNEEVTANKLKRSMKKTKEKSLANFFKSSKYIEKSYIEDKYNLETRYNELGYRDAMILSDSVVQISPNRVKILLNVQEGSRYYFNDITFVNNTKYASEDLLDILKIKKGDVYNTTYLQERLRTDDDAVINYYQNYGYLFSQIQEIETIVGKDSINLEIRLFEGPQARIDRVKIKGNSTTHEHVIRRELYTLPGDLYSREKVMNSLRTLSNMGHFDPEQFNIVPNPNPEQGTVDLTYEVVEKSNDRFELSGGWGAGMIIGSVGLTFTNFSIRNIFNREAYHPLPQGDGQTLSLQAQTNGKYYSNFALSFMEPWLGGRKPNSFSVSVNFSRQTGFTSSYSDYYYTNQDLASTKNQSMITYGVNVGLGRRINWPDYLFQMSNSISFQRYDLNNWQYYIFTNGSSNTLAFSTTIRRSSTFNPIFPKSGSDFALSVTFTPPYSLFANKEHMENEKDRDKYRWIEYHKWKFYGKIFVPLTGGGMFDDVNSRPLVLYAGVQYGYLGHYSKYRRSPFEGFEMGGDGMSGYNVYGREYIGLRGYENGSLTNAGSSFITPKSADAIMYSKFTMELRYPIILGQNAQTIYALAFMEAGNSWNKLKDFEPFNLYRSAGVGLRIFLPMFGLLGLDWGYGFDKVPGRPGAAGAQFHFVLGQEF